MFDHLVRDGIILFLIGVTILTKICPFIKQSRLSDMIATSLDRSVDFAGVVKNNGGTLSGTIRRKDYSGEIWVLKIREDGTCVFMVAGSVRDGFCIFDQNVQPTLSNLEPLFAPFDGKNTESLADSFRKQAKELDIKEIKWPACWPLKGE